MPATRVTKQRAAAQVPATPRRATRSSVREGSASLETPVAASTRPRRANGRSRSTTPTSSAEELAPAQVHQLPSLQEEITTPRPSEFAPIIDATPYYTPRAPVSLPDPVTVAPIVDASPYYTPRVPVTFPNPSEVAPFADASPYNTPRAPALSQASEVAAALIKSSAHKKISPRKTASPRKTPRVPAVLPQPSEVAPIVDVSPYKTPRVSVPLPRPSEVAPIADASPYKTPRVPTPKIRTPEYLRQTQPSPPDSAAAVLEDFISQPSLLYELTAVNRSQLLLDMRKEIIRLRKVEVEHKAAQQQSAPTPPQQQEPLPDMAHQINKRARDLRYQMTIARPAAARAAAEAAAAEAAKVASPEPKAETTTLSSSPAVKTPEKSVKSSSPGESPSASPSWGITTLFGSVRGMFANRPILSPSKQQTSPSAQSPVQQSPVQQSPIQESPSQQARTQRSTQQRVQKRSQHTVEQSPSRERSAAKADSSATPVPEEQPSETPRKVRRRGVLPGSLRKPINSRTPPQPRETNADRRAAQLVQVNEKAAERKRLQDQADKIEQERLHAVQEQRKHAEEEAARQQAGSKRKRIRVRVDDLKCIPAHAPGQTGTYGLLDEFFAQNSDSDEDDYVEMYAKDIVLRDTPSSRPAKKLRLDENVFQPKTPAAQPAATSPVKQPQPTPEPATPALNYSQLTQQAIEKQRVQYSQHKPKQPSRLRNVERLSTGSNGASSPLQPVSASGLNAPKRPDLGTSPTKTPIKDVASSSPTPLSGSPMDISPYVTSSVAPVGTILDLAASDDGYLPACQVEIDLAACFEPISRVHNRLSNITEVTEPDTPSPMPRQVNLPPCNVQWPGLKPLASAETIAKIKRTMPITPEMRAANLKRFAEGVAERVRLEDQGLVSRDIPNLRPCPWSPTL